MPFERRFIPDHFVSSIYEIAYDSFEEQGITTLFFDLDNTLIAYDDHGLGQREIEFLTGLMRRFKVVIVSNSSHKRVTGALGDVKTPCVWRAKKPLAFGIRKALHMTSSKAEETVLIGDQLMTDVFVSNRLGLKSVLVRSVKRSSDKWVTRINRLLEKMILNRIRKREPELYSERLEAYVDQR